MLEQSVNVGSIAYPSFVNNPVMHVCLYTRRWTCSFDTHFDQSCFVSVDQVNIGYVCMPINKLNWVWAGFCCDGGSRSFVVWVQSRFIGGLHIVNVVNSLDEWSLTHPHGVAILFKPKHDNFKWKKALVSFVLFEVHKCSFLNAWWMIWPK